VKKETTDRIAAAFDEIANCARDIRAMGIFELRAKFKPVLARLERAAVAAAEAVRRDVS